MCFVSVFGLLQLLSKLMRVFDSKVLVTFFAVALDEPIHMIIAWFVSLFEFIVQELRVVDSKPAVLATHANHLVDHVQPVFRHFRTLKLINDYLRLRLVLGLFLGKMRHFWASAEFFLLLLLEVLVDILVGLHQPVVILLNNVVPLSIRASWPL